MWLLFSLLSASAFAVVNILDSIIVQRYEKHPLVIMWLFGVLRLLMLLPFPFFVDLRTDYAWMLMGCGLILGAALVLYLYVLDHMDASVTQSAWAIESVILSLLGFAFLAESWSGWQTTGALLILTAVFALSYWHRHVSIARTVGLLLLLGAVTAAAEFGVKVALSRDTAYPVVLFWFLFGTGSASVILPLFRRDARARLRRTISSAPPAFFAFLGCSIGMSFLGFAAAVKAFQVGMLSLATIASNIQPFLVIFFAWILAQTKATQLPKELLSPQSVIVKLACFALAFTGLALLVTNT